MCWVAALSALLSVFVLSEQARAEFCLVANTTKYQIPFDVVSNNSSDASLSSRDAPGDERARRYSLSPGDLVRVELVNAEAELRYSWKGSVRAFQITDATAYLFGTPTRPEALPFNRINLKPDPSLPLLRSLPEVFMGDSVEETDPQRATDTITVKLAIQDGTSAPAQEKMHEAVRQASQVLQRYFGLRLKVIATDTWETRGSLTRQEELLSDFAIRVKPESADLAIGYLSRVWPRGTLQQSWRPVHPRHILVGDWQDASEAERVALVLYGVGRFLGGLDSPEPGSAMIAIDGKQAISLDKIRFDLPNAMILSLTAQELRTRGAQGWNQYAPNTRSQLFELYNLITQTRLVHLQGPREPEPRPGPGARPLPEPTPPPEMQERGSPALTRDSMETRPNVEMETQAEPEVAALASRPATQADLEKPRLLLSRLSDSGNSSESSSNSPSRRSNREGVGPRSSRSAEEVARMIDAAIDKRLADEGLVAAPQADDEVFLRRIYLDLAGTVPTLDESRRFLEDTAPDKREKLIEELLESPRFGRRLADIWIPLVYSRQSKGTMHVPEDSLLWWLRREFNANRPWDSMATELLTASGPQDVNPAVTFMMGPGLEALSPSQATKMVSSAFLGVQLQCAQCHDHPFAKWKKTDFWGMAHFFRYIEQTHHWPESVRELAMPTDDKVAANGMIVTDRGVIDVNKPRKRENSELAQIPPRLLGGGPISSQAATMRHAFADWMTAPDNPYFARAMVNRLWAQYFGRGMVEPLDDQRVDNPPTHPELMEALAREFIAHDYDIKFIVEVIVRSEAYQRSSVASPGDTDGERLYAHVPVKVMDGAQLFDSLVTILGEQAMLRDDKQLLDWRGGARPIFKGRFSDNRDPDPTEYRRGILDLLQLMNDRGYESGIRRQIAQHLNETPPREYIEQLYLQTLVRRPSDSEVSAMMRYVQQQPDPQSGYVDVLWVLLNGSEFPIIQ